MIAEDRSLQTPEPPAASPATKTRERIGDLFDANGGDLLRFFERRCESPEEAADLLGELFLLALRKKLPDDSDRARMLLFGMAKNLLRSSLRSRLRRSAASARLRDVMIAQITSSPQTSDVDLAVDVRAAIARLPTRQRDVVTLMHWDGFSQQETADILGIPFATVRSRYSRARKALAVMLTVGG